MSAPASPGSRVPAPAPRTPDARTTPAEPTGGRSGAATVGRKVAAAGGRVPPAVAVLAAIGSVQIGGALAKNLFDRVGPTGAVTLRLVLAAAAMLALTRPHPRRYPAAHWRVLVAYAVVLAAMNWCFYLALDRLPLGVAVTVEFVGPLAVALGGSRRARDAAWAVLAAAGVVLLTGVVGPGAGTAGAADPVGIAFALGAAACWAAYILLGARLGRTEPGLGSLAVALALGAVVVAPFGIAAAGTRLVSPLALLGGVGVALLSSAVPYSVELSALRRIPTRVFGVLMSLEPAAAALAGLIVLGESLDGREVVAIVLVSVASVGATRSGAGHPAAPAA